MRLTLLLPIFLLSFFINGCESAEEPVNTKEASIFTKELLNAFTKKEPAFLSSRIHAAALTKRMKPYLKSGYSASIKNGVVQALKSSRMETEIYATASKSGSFELVKQYEAVGQQHVVFRLYGEGLNYFDATLAKIDGKTGIVDLLVYTTGEYLSKSLAEMMERFIDQGDEKGTDAMEQLTTVKKLVAKGNFEHAKRDFDQLPASIRDNRLVAIMGIQIASNLSNEVYMKEIEKFERQYGNDPMMQLSMIDLYLLRQDYERALRSVNQLDSLIDKDPFLDYYRGLIYGAKDDNATASQYYQQLLKSMPTFAPAVAELMAIAIQDNDRTAAKSYFKQYRTMKAASEETLSTYRQLYSWLDE